MDRPLSDSEIADYLEKVDRSGVLGKSPRRLKLLEYIILEELRGDGGNLKAYSIGIDVLDRPQDFDPTIDSSVRVEMGRLRTALTTFENSAAANSAFSVTLPVGSYQPVIQARQDIAVPQDDAGAPTAPKTRKRGIVLALIAVVCLGLVASVFAVRNANTAQSGVSAVRLSLGSFDGDVALAARVGTALRQNLVRNRTIAVSSQTTPEPQGTDFFLDGLISEAGDGSNRLSVELLNIGTNRIVWTKTMLLSANDDVEARVSEVIGNELRVRLLGASKEFLQGRDPERLTPEQLFVVATWVPGPTATNSLAWENERIALMNWALARDPSLGSLHSVIADKLGQMANYYAASNTPALQDKVLSHIARATELKPLDPDVMLNIAQAHWHAGRTRQSHIAMRRVLDLDPGHDVARFLSQVIPYTCQAPPKAVIDDAIQFDATLSPDNPIRWLTLTWIAWLHLNSGDYETALQAKQAASLIFETPYTFIGHAMLLNELGRTEEAVDVIRRQQTNWPDISAEYFATVTMPRLCREAADPQQLIENYNELARAVSGKL